MSWEEQATSLEQTAQEILRTREGTVASESGEEIGDPQEGIEAARVYQESPVQIRDFPEVQATQGMGELLYQQSQLLMKWMQDDPYLIITPALPTTTQEEARRSQAAPIPQNLGNTNGLGNTGSTTSSVNSPVDRTNQTETGRVSIETQAPNPLSKLIHIYSDDESPGTISRLPCACPRGKGPEKVFLP
jgi:hypothetical protein